MTPDTVQRWARYVPAVSWIRSYDRTWLVRDVLGGLAAGSVVIPQAMAYATIADLPAQVGLYTCMAPMLAYVLLGGSRTLSVSTTSTVAVLTGSTLLTAGVAAASSDPARDLATLTLLVGIILLIARLLKLGALVENISEATQTGIKIGVGLTVAAGQLPKLLGIPGDPDAHAFIGEVRGVIEDLADLSWSTPLLSAATIGLLLGVRRFAPNAPAPLIGVAVGIALVAVLEIDEHGVALISPVPSGLPTPVAPSLEHVTGLLGGAFAIAVMCFLETASVAGAMRRRDEPPVDNDEELAANAIACIAGSFLRAMPAAGGFSQTALNRRAGSRTQISAVVTVLLAVACALFLGGILSDLPQATLGSLVVVSVLGLIDPAELGRFWRLDRLGFWVATVTAVAGLVFGLLPAVVVGIVSTLFLVLRELDRVGVTELQPTIGGDDVGLPGPSTARVPGLLILKFDGPLYTANVRGALRRVINAVDAARPDTVILEMSAVGWAPLTVIDQLVELRQMLRTRDVNCWIAALSPNALATARQLPQWDTLAAERQLFPSALSAVRAYVATRSA